MVWESVCVCVLMSGSMVALPSSTSADSPAPPAGATVFDADADGRLDAQVAAFRDLSGASETIADLKYDQQFLVAELLARLRWYDGVMYARVNELALLTQVEVTVEPALVAQIREFFSEQVSELGLQRTVLKVVGSRWSSEQRQRTQDQLRERFAVMGLDVSVAEGAGDSLEIRALAEASERDRSAVAAVVSALQVADQVEVVYLEPDVPASLVGGGEYMTYCTSGFTVLDPTEGPAVLTAGHCPDVESLWDSTQSPPLQLALGDAVSDAYSPSLPQPIDRQLHPLQFGEVPDPAIRIAATNVRWAITGTATPGVGQLVCKFGSRDTVLRCGQVLQTNRPNVPASGDPQLDGLTVADVDVRAGDSGGPVYMGTSAVGINTAITLNYGGSCWEYIPAGDPNGTCVFGSHELFTPIGLALSGTGAVLMGGNAMEYNPVAVTRLLDTRTSGGALPAGSIRNIQVAGLAGVPAGLEGSVVMNVTTVNQTSNGYLKLWAFYSPEPVASSANFDTGGASTTLVVVPLSESGMIRVKSSATTDLILDVVGYYTTTGLLAHVAPNPARVYDSRPSAPIAGGATRDVTIAAAPASSWVVLNVTLPSPTQNTYLTLYRPGSSAPYAAHVSAQPGTVMSNLVIAQLDSLKRVRVANSAGLAHVVIDYLGYYNGVAGAGASRTVPLPATRVADTRYSLNLTGPFSAGQTRTIQIADFWPAPVVPGNAIAVVVNVTAVNATATTFLRVGPTTANDTSTVNVQPGAAASNHSIVALNSNGDIQIYNYAGTVDVIVDLEGYLYG